MTFRNLRAAWKRRSLPTTLRALRGARASYSQFGEDVVADALFGPKYGTGFYIDVGCFDPIKWSNTYKFYLKGWRGVCIDPNPTLAPLWRRLRPRDRYLDLALSDTPGTVAYHLYSDFPSENRLESHSSSASCPASDTLRVRADRLESILRLYLPIRTCIDLMSIDCEGHDLSVLRSNDFEAFRPRLLIVEDFQRGDTSEIDELCRERDYKLAGLCAWSKLFLDRHWLRTRRQAKLDKEGK